MKRLAWPFGLELVLQLVMGSVDTFMVSRLGDAAVSAVGLSNQLLTAAATLLVFVNAGSGIVAARFWGAQRHTDLRRLVKLLIGFNAVVGGLLGLAFLWGAPFLLAVAGAPPAVRDYAMEYLPLVGGGLALMAGQVVMGGVFRSVGDSRTPLAVALGMNGLHLVLNGGFLFGWLGMPVLGVTGTAVSTLICRALAFLVLLVLVQGRIGREQTKPPAQAKELWGEVLAVGIPVSVTAVAWSLSQVAVTSLVARQGADALASWTYFQNLQQYPFVAISAIGGALQVLVAQRYGAGDRAGARLQVRKALPWAVGAGVLLAAVEAVLAYGLLGIFTRSASVVELAVPLMLFAVLWHPLRAVAYCLSSSLNAMGRAPAVAATTVAGMWIVGVGGPWFSTFLGMSTLLIVLISQIADELARSITFVVLWRKSSCHK